MSTMNISLPEELKAFVDRRIRDEGYGSSSEYLRELIRKDRDRVQFRQFLMAGVEAKPAGKMDKAYFDGLRRRVKKGSKRQS
jgi:antitoxin ParD1/3/4